MVPYDAADSAPETEIAGADAGHGSSGGAQQETESRLFTAAVTHAVQCPSIASFIRDYIPAAEVYNAIELMRDEIWAVVQATRGQLRDAQQALQAAEESATHSVLDEQDDEREWVRQRFDLSEQVRAAGEYAEAKRHALRLAENKRYVSGAESLVRDTESKIQREGEAADGAPGRLGAKRPSAKAPARLRRSPRSGAGGTDDARSSAELEYKKALASLTEIQRAYGDFLSAAEQRMKALRPLIESKLRHDSSWMEARLAVRERTEALADELFREGTLPIATAFVNARAGDLAAITMEAPAESGLYDTRPHPNPVATKAIEKVEDWLSRMKGASIGIAGPRGAGKTTLIEYFCPANPGDTPSSEITRNWVRLRVSAPVEYVPLDFICHLVAGLCEAILLMHPLRGPSPTDSAPPTGSRSKQAWLWLRRIDAAPGYPGMLSLATLMSAVLLAAITIADDEHLARAGIAVLAMGTLVAVTVFGRAAWPIIPRPRPTLSSLPRTLTMIATSTLTICLAGLLIAGFAVGQGAPDAASFLTESAVAGAATALLFVFAMVAVPPSPARRAAVCAALAALAACAALRWQPPHPALLGWGCTATAAGATLLLVIPLVPKVGVSFQTACAALVIAGLASTGLARFPGALNYPLCAACGLLAAGIVGLRPPRSRRGRFLFAGPDSVPVWPVDGERASAQESKTQEIAEQATQLHGYLEYAQTLSRGLSRTWTAGVGGNLPLSYAYGTSSAASWARQPLTVPVAVAQFRKLAEQVAQLDGGALVCIDELDKLEYDKSTTFLNDIKAIFGVPRTFFLASVSENAAAGFERRGVPFRDVFDSSFDDIVLAGYLNWPDSQELLSGLVVGMYAPFKALCYMFAGGLARDLIRAARDIVSCGDREGKVRLSVAVTQLCRDEMLGKTHGVFRELASLTEDEYAMALLAHVQSSDERFEIAADYLEWSDHVSTWIRDTTDGAVVAPGAGKALRFARELAVFGYFTATVHQFFSEELSRDRFEGANIERLARARQAMAVSPIVAERDIIEFRSSFPGWRLPRPVSGLPDLRGPKGLRGRSVAGAPPGQPQ